MLTPKALFEFLEHSARLDPDRTAVIEPDRGSITYGELHALANQLRDRLYHLGVAAEIVSGFICINPSILSRPFLGY